MLEHGKYVLQYYCELLVVVGEPKKVCIVLYNVSCRVRPNISPSSFCNSMHLLRCLCNLNGRLVLLRIELSFCGLTKRVVFYACEMRQNVGNRTIPTLFLLKAFFELPLSGSEQMLTYYEVMGFLPKIS